VSPGRKHEDVVGTMTLLDDGSGWLPTSREPSRLGFALLKFFQSEARLPRGPASSPDRGRSWLAAPSYPCCQLTYGLWKRSTACAGHCGRGAVTAAACRPRSHDCSSLVKWPIAPPWAVTVVVGRTGRGVSGGVGSSFKERMRIARGE
jgi:hypothetical protein